MNKVASLRKTILSVIESRFVFFFVLLAIAAFGVWILRYITPYGLGLINDSVGYIAGARNLLAGNGYSRLNGDWIPVPITNYPPLYSMILAAIGVTGLEIIRASRFVSLLCFAINIILTGLTLYKITRSQGFAIIGSFLFSISEVFLFIHSFALSEPVYLVINYLVLLLLAQHIEKPGWVWMTAAGLLASLAYLARYVGVSLYATTLLVLFIFHSKWYEKIKYSIIFITAGTPAVAAWTIRNAILSGNPVNRYIAFHPITPDKIVEGIRNFWVWLLPNHWVQVDLPESAWGIGLYSIISILFIWTVLKLIISPKSMPQPTWLIFSLNGIIYLSLLIFTLTFLDSSPIFEHRILSPFYICLFILGMSSLAWIWYALKRPGRVAVILFLAGSFVSFAPDSFLQAQHMHEYGQGFIGLQWQKSGTIQAVRDLPRVTLFSNRPTALYLLAEHPAFALLSPYNPATSDTREGSDEAYTNVRQMVLDKKAMLVIFDYARIKENPNGIEWLLEILDGLPVYGEYWDGAIFGTLPDH